jgi:hypothetical protein
MSSEKMPFEKTRFLEKPELVCSSCGELAMVSRSQKDSTKLEATCRTRTCQAFDIRYSFTAKSTESMSSPDEHLELLRWAGERPIEEIKKR